MKNIVKVFLLGLLISFTSCSDSEVLIDDVYDTVDTESGAVVRTLSEIPDLVSLTNPDNNVIPLDIEIQQGNGSFYPDFKLVRAYVQLYADQDLIEPIATDDGVAIPESLLYTVEESVFELGPNGLPRTSLEIPTQGIADLYADSTLPIPSFISLRMEIEMNDGTIWTNTDVGATISGGIYFNSPFLYRLIFLPL